MLLGAQALKHVVAEAATAAVLTATLAVAGSINTWFFGGERHAGQPPQGASAGGRGNDHDKQLAKRRVVAFFGMVWVAFLGPAHTVGSSP